MAPGAKDPFMSGGQAEAGAPKESPVSDELKQSMFPELELLFAPA